MRGGKSFLALVAIAAAVVAYAYFVESKKDLSETPEAKKEKIWTLDSGKIEEIEIKAANGDLTKLKKAGTTWQIVAPQPMDADQDAVSTIVSAVSTVESNRTVDEHATALSGYELEPPRTRVTVRLNGESAAKQLDLGTKTPTGADLYARVDGQPKVFLLGSFLEDQLNRTTFDLREKSVLKFDRDKADLLKIEAGGSQALTLVKKSSEEWRLSAPVDGKADFSAVDGIVSKLSQAKMKSVAAQDLGSDAKKYGLDKPQAVATVGAGSARATLDIGAKAPDGTLYAKDAARPLVFTVEASLLDDVKKKPDDVRQKMLFEFRSFTALSMDVVHGAETVSFVKETATPPAKDASQSSVPTETWKQTKPAAKAVDQTKMTDLLVNIANLKADSFVDRAATGGEDYTVSVRFGEAKSPKDERVTFRKSGSTVHAIRQGEPGAAVISTADFDKVVSGLKELTGGK